MEQEGEKPWDKYYPGEKPAYQENPDTGALEPNPAAKRNEQLIETQNELERATTDYDRELARRKKEEYLKTHSGKN